jgi:4-amino-4-deoxy-L-arabinose transferase-like glycosyltransferase
MSVHQERAGAIGVRAPAFQLVSSAWGFALIVGVYLVLHIALRLWETPIIAKNDVQEAVAAQVWAWGYHPRNPPLHTWLLMGSYSVFGPGLMAHVALKYTLLGGVYAFAYLCARRLLSTTTVALVAALSMTLLGPLAWTVHTALTHTLLMAVLILATLWAAMRLTDRHRLGDYALFGAMVGLGLLAKYSFLLFLAPLVVAVLTQRDLRRAVCSPRMLAALAALTVVVAPHALWLLGQPFDFIDFLTHKQQSEIAQPYFQDVVVGLGAVLVGTLSFAALFVPTTPIVFRRLFNVQAEAPSEWQRAVVFICVFGIGLLTLDVFVLRATQFELRYFTCALLVAPLAVFQWIDRRRPSHRQLQMLSALVAVVAVVGFAGLAGRALWANRTCDRCWEEMPVSNLSQALRAGGFARGTIIADHYSLAGNMRLAFPDSRTVAANYDVILLSYRGPGTCVLVWNARNAGDAVPPSIREYLQSAGLPPVHDQPRYVDALLRRSNDRLDRFGYVMVSGVEANCQASPAN